MKKLLVLTMMVGVGLGHVAWASDAPVVEEPAYEPAPYVAEAPVFKWQGFYVGFNMGFIRASTKFKTQLRAVTSLDNLKGTFKKGNFTGGVQLGVNYLSDNFLYGVEGDFNYSGVKQSNDCAKSGGYVVKCTFSMNYFGTLRPRIGYVFGERYLVYGTGGLTVYNSKLEAKVRGFSREKNKQGVGWNVGAGLEAMITDSISVKGEYIYHRLGSLKLKATDFPANLNFPGESFNTDKTQLHTIRVGLNYHF